MTNESVVEECRVALIEILNTYGDEGATAEVLSRVSNLEYDGNGAAYALAVASIARAVWQRKLEQATARLKDVESQAAALKAVSLWPVSKIVH